MRRRRAARASSITASTSAGGADVVRERHAAPAAGVLDAAVLGELVAAHSATTMQPAWKKTTPSPRGVGAQPSAS